MSEKANSGLSSLTPVKVLHIIISIGIMVGFKFIPASEPLTPLGVEVLGVFLGMLYGWLVAGDSFWPSILGLIGLGLTEYSTVPKVFTAGFGNSTVLLLFFFFVFTNIMNAAGITDYIARWMVTRKFVQGKPAIIFTAIICILACVISNFANNIASSAMLTPIIYTIGLACGANTMALVICMMFGVNIGLATPPASAPAAIIHGDKDWIPGGDAVKYGIIFSIINLICIFLVAFPLGNLLF